MFAAQPSMQMHTCTQNAKTIFGNAHGAGVHDTQSSLDIFWLKSKVSILGRAVNPWHTVQCFALWALGCQMSTWGPTINLDSVGTFTKFVCGVKGLGTLRFV
jgi:hypothetical protein